jgi:hypothetical protein
VRVDLSTAAVRRIGHCAEEVARLTDRDVMVSHMDDAIAEALIHP